MFKYYAILLGGEGESPKRSQKITWGRGEVHQKITGDHNHKGGRREKIGQTEGAQKGNNYSQDQLSMSGLIGDIFIDKY